MEHIFLITRFLLVVAPRYFKLTILHFDVVCEAIGLLVVARDLRLFCVTIRAVVC